MISVSQLISLTLKTPYKIDVQPVNCSWALPYSTLTKKINLDVGDISFKQ